MERIKSCLGFLLGRFIVPVKPQVVPVKIPRQNGGKRIWQQKRGWGI